MNIKPTAENWLDSEGRPAGGVAFGPGFAISWQNGPLGTGPDRKEPNGAFVESVLSAVAQRIEHYQSTQFNCQENADALASIRRALAHLNSRTSRRTSQGVEGTHSGS